MVNKLFKVFLITLIFAVPVFTLSYVPSIFAAGACLSQNPTTARAEWLVSAAGTDNFKSRISQCAISTNPDDVKFNPALIPTYKTMKQNYYDRKSVPTLTFSNSTVYTDNTYYHTVGDVTIDHVSGTGKAVVFISKNPDGSGGNLNIKGNLINSGDDKGIIFVVEGNVNIDLTPVNQIDAFIMAFGVICTGAPHCSTTDISQWPAQQLVVNGSFISFNNDATVQYPIIFSRRYDTVSNNEPAELFNYQPKYLVLFKTMFSDSIQKWQEVSGQ